MVFADYPSCSISSVRLHCQRFRPQQVPTLSAALALSRDCVSARNRAGGNATGFAWTAFGRRRPPGRCVFMAGQKRADSTGGLMARRPTVPVALNGSFCQPLQTTWAMRPN